MNAAETLDVAGARGGEAVDGSDDAQRHGAVQARQVGLRLGGKDDALVHEGSW